jgi:hypothetical protein
MDVFLPAYQYLQPGAKLTARMKHWSQSLTMPEDATTIGLEVLKFLGLVALIVASGLILLMAG